MTFRDNGFQIDIGEILNGKSNKIKCGLIYAKLTLGISYLVMPSRYRCVVLAVDFPFACTFEPSTLPKPGNKISHLLDLLTEHAFFCKLAGGSLKVML